ncbi:MAG: hypothetical protein QOH46_3342 [Solirubrobacteraceae bacterium]|nr:hypothetical protein [Solirubrobacteraceae bacterium]
MRRLIAVLTLTVALIASAALPAVAGGPNNDVFSEATATPEGTPATVERSSLQVLPTGTDELTSRNVAQAYSHDCTGCRAVAVALQAVIVTGNPSTVAPVNVGAAVNERCSSCATYAFAYQYVVSADDVDDLSWSARRTIWQLRREADDLARSGLPFPELDAQLRDVAARLKAAVDAEIERSGSKRRDRREEEHSDIAPAPAATQ